MQTAASKLEEQEKIIKFLASKYERDTGRRIVLPNSLGDLLKDPSVKGEHALVE